MTQIDKLVPDERSVTRCALPHLLKTVSCHNALDGGKSLIQEYTWHTFRIDET